MRKRAKRDLVTILGVVVVLLAVLGVNTYMRLDTLKEAAEKARQMLEAKHRGQGVKLIDWSDMRKNRGYYRTGATFTEDMQKLDGRLVNLVGYMSPINQFRNVTNFMLLPVPLTCYFCEMPPMRDVVEIKLQAPANMVNEPVLIGGRLRLHSGPKQPFFYTIEDAKWNEAVKDEELSPQDTSPDHVIHLQQGFEELLEGKPQQELEQGFAPPSAAAPGAAGAGPGSEHTPALPPEQILPPQEVPKAADPDAPAQ